MPRDINDLTLKQFIIVLNHTVRRTGGTAESLGDLKFLAIRDMMEIYADSALEDASLGSRSPSEANGHATPNGHRQPVA